MGFIRRWPVFVYLSAIVWGAPLDVPFVRQQKQGCGPAALAMVMQYWQNQGAQFSDGVAVASNIYRVLYRSDLGGASGADMLAYLRHQGFTAFEIDGAWSDLTENIAHGRPVVVCLRPSPKAPYHYVVVVDISAAQVVVHDPARRPGISIPAAVFEKEWQRSTNWTLIAAPEQLP
jgi:predicted double-glycine peptidase